ncbi:hypothetical protein Tco_1244826 [Tanacetum coccineum]
MGRGTIQLEDAISTISGEYLLKFTSEYGIPEDLHPEFPGPEETIIDFLEAKVGVYTKFFEFTNYHIPLSQFPFKVLGYYQIHLSQLSVIGTAKVSHFEVTCHVLNIIHTLNLFRMFYIPSCNSGWMSFNKRPGKNIPQCYTKPLDSMKNWNNSFFCMEERIFPTVMAWRTSAPKEEMPSTDTYSTLDVVTLDTRRTPIQKQPELLLCLVGLSRRYFLGDDVASNPTKVKTGTRPRTAHEVSLLTATATRVIDMEEVTEASKSSGIPSPIEKSPLDFANEDPLLVISKGVRTGGQARDEVPHEIPLAGNPPTTEVALDMELEAAAMGSLVRKRRCGRGSDRANANSPPKVLRKDHTSIRSEQKQEIAQSSEIPTGNVATAEVQKLQSAGSSESGKSTSISSIVGSPEEVRLLKKSRAQIVRPDQRIQVREDEIKRLDQEIESLQIVEEEVHGLRNRTKNLESLMEVEVDMKRVAEDKNAELTEELESPRAQFSDLQVNNNKLWQQVSNLKAQVIGEEKIKAAFEDFKKYEDDKVEQRCVEMDARLDALSIDFDEELYPHMLKAIASCLWVIGHGILLAVMKCAESTELRKVFINVVSVGIAKGMSEGLKHGVEHGKAKLDLVAIEAYDPEADAKYIAALHALKDLRYPLVDQLEKLKNAPIDLIMASLHLEKVSDPRNPWAFKEEILLEDAVAANISRAEKKKKCRVVCRTHGVGFAHHARSDGVPVSVPTIAPQGIAILLADAATQTETSEDEASPRLIRSKSLPPMYNLNWP